MQMLPSKRQEENCTGRYSKGLTNQNGEHFRESNNFEIQVKSLGSQNFIGLFPVLKVQIT